MFTYQGKTALITGASSGIGTTFAHELASKGMNVILLARNEERLRTLATEIAEKFSVQTEVIVADLGQEHSAQRVYEEVQHRGLNVDMLINNAGFGTHGHFETLDAARDHEEIMVNVAALVDLTHAFIPAMVKQGSGAVINIASTAGFQPLPYMAVYGATKAFVISFSAALAQEYRKRGIRVLALCPGATTTSFFDVVGTEDAAVGRKRTTQQVVATGLQAFERGKSVVIDGGMNTFLARTVKILPFPLAARLAERAMGPRGSRHRSA